MCDFAEGEWAEYLRWKEAAAARRAVAPPRTPSAKRQLDSVWIAPAVVAET